MENCRAALGKGDAPNIKSGYYASSPVGSGLLSGVDSQTAYNKAYASLVNKVRSSPEVGVNIAERKQAMNSIAVRGTQLLNAARALRHGSVGRFLEALHIIDARGKYRRIRPDEAAGVWLEYHFGWEPLFKDIYEAVDLLQHGFRANHVWGKGNTGFKQYLRDYVQSGSHYVDEWVHRMCVRMGCTVSVSNPNLQLASQLGLINPIAIAWELVPFSFVVDWVYPVGQFLNSWTDFAGLTLTDTYTTTYAVCRGSYTETYLATGALILEQKGNAYGIKRVKTLTFPVPVLRPFKLDISPTRGATAIALLVQELASIEEARARGRLGRF
jgi:hypothetical protein